MATDKGQIKIIVDGPQPIVEIDGEAVRIEGLDGPLTLRAGPHDLSVHWGDGESKRHRLNVHRGDNGEMHVDYEPKPAPRPAPVEPPAPPAPSWVSLFNGKDLTGWVVDGGDEKAWLVKGEELVVRGAEKDLGGGGQGYLLTERDYEDFRLRLQFQRSSDAAYSGIALRAVPHETPHDSDPGFGGAFPYILRSGSGSMRPGGKERGPARCGGRPMPAYRPRYSQPIGRSSSPPVNGMTWRLRLEVKR